MNVFRIIITILTVIGVILEAYMLIDLFIVKIKFKKNKVKNVSNAKYIVIMAILLAIFIIYGLLRNLA